MLLAGQFSLPLPIEQIGGMLPERGHTRGAKVFSPVQGLEGLLGILPDQQATGEIHLPHRPRRIDFDDLPEVDLGLCPLPPVHQADTEVVMGLHEIAIQFHSPLKVLKRFIEPSQLQQRVTPVVVSLGIARIPIQRRTEQLYALQGVLLLHTKHAQHVQNACRVGRGPPGAFQTAHGFVQTAVLLQLDRRIEVGARQVVLTLPFLPGQSDCLLIQSLP